MRADSPEVPDPTWSDPDPGAEDSGVELAADAAEPDADPMLAQLEADAQQRLWLRSVIPLLKLRTQEPDPNCRVQFALDRMCIAACERVTRILRSDLGETLE